MHYIWISMHALQLNYVNYSWTSMHYSWSRNISDELPCTAAELASTTAKLACLLQLAYLLHTLQQTFHILCTADLTYTIAELACISADVNIMLSALTYVYSTLYTDTKYCDLWMSRRMRNYTQTTTWWWWLVAAMTGKSCWPGGSHAHTPLVVMHTPLWSSYSTWPCSLVPSSVEGGGEGSLYSTLSHEHNRRRHFIANLWRLCFCIC